MPYLVLLMITVAVALGACSSEDGPIVAGGPTKQEAREAVLGNSSIWPAQATEEAKQDVKTMRLETMHCTAPGPSYIQCDVRLYTKAMGWSAPTPATFSKAGGRWSFYF
jgi:hypothetical protein